MLQLHNTSPFVPAIFGLPDCAGIDTLVVVVKATFELGPLPRIAEKQRPIVLADEYWGDPTASSLRYPSEVHLGKPATDVIVIGSAHAPHGQPVTELDVAVRVGDRSQRVRVYGDRHWTAGLRGLQPSEAKPFVRMPITWERAYGGRILGSAGQVLAEPRNPVGVGFADGRNDDELLGHPVPNLDDPDDPLVQPGQPARPMGFAAIAPSWQPRTAYAGTYDERWRKTRSPYLPEDFDPRYFQAASAGLIVDPPLVGGEPILLAGFDPNGTWQFALPRCSIDILATVADFTHHMIPMLDTVVLEPDEGRFTMTWRATLAVDRQLLRIERVDVGLASIQGAIDPGKGPS
jgi:hypothetical protein